MDKVKVMVAKNDARRWAESMVDYGEGSRIKRINLERELRIKRKDPEYDREFIKELDSIDNDQIFEDLQKKKNVKDAYQKAKRAYRSGKRAYRLFKDNVGIIVTALEKFGII